MVAVVDLHMFLQACDAVIGTSEAIGLADYNIWEGHILGWDSDAKQTSFIHPGEDRADCGEVTAWNISRMGVAVEAELLNFWRIYRVVFLV